MKHFNDSIERRDLLQRTAVFGVAAAGAVLGPWTPASLASMSPPAALGGSESLLFDGPGEAHIDPETGKGFLHLWLEGFGALGSWDIHLLTPSEPTPGVHMVANMSPALADFTGGAHEVKNVFLTFCIEQLDAGAEDFQIKYVLQAVPVGNDGSPVVVEKDITVFMRP